MYYYLQCVFYQCRRSNTACPSLQQLRDVELSIPRYEPKVSKNCKYLIYYHYGVRRRAPSRRPALCSCTPCSPMTSRTRTYCVTPSNLRSHISHDSAAPSYALMRQYRYSAHSKMATRHAQQQVATHRTSNNSQCSSSRTHFCALRGSAAGLPQNRLSSLP